MIERRKLEFLESDRSGCAKYLPWDLASLTLILSSLICRMEVVLPPTPRPRPQAEMNVGWVPGPSTAPGTVRMLNQLTNG